jgi:2-enoate reductase
LNGLMGRLPVTALLNRRATIEDIKNFNADYVVLATGAAMESAPFNNDTVLTTIELLSGREPRGEKILIMGAGVTGCETALYLAQQGRRVVLCARQDADTLDTDILDLHNREMLFRMLEEEKNITVLRAAIPVRMEAGGVVADVQGREQKISADSVVFAGRLFPQNELSRAFENQPQVISIGDCVAPGTIMEAVWGGFNAVKEIEP